VVTFGHDLHLFVVQHVAENSAEQRVVTGNENLSHAALLHISAGQKTVADELPS